MSVINCCFKLIIKLKIARFSVNDFARLQKKKPKSYHIQSTKSIDNFFLSRSHKIVEQFYIKDEYIHCNGNRQQSTILQWNKYRPCVSKQPDSAQWKINQPILLPISFILIRCDGFIAKLIDNGQSCAVFRMQFTAFASDVYVELSN